MQPIFATVGPLVAASATNIRTATTASAGTLTLDGTLVSGGVATLDTFRRVLITTTSNSDNGKTLVLTGTNWAGSRMSDGTGTARWTETITLGNAGTFQSVLDYKTLTSVVLSSNSVGNISIGTSGVASSAWMKLNHWIDGRVAIQLVVSGTVNYTLQQTLDDPGNPVNPIEPASVTWFSSSDTAVVGATSSQQSNYGFAPVFTRILLNSQTNPGYVAGTFLQNGSQ